MTTPYTTETVSTTSKANHPWKTSYKGDWREKEIKRQEVKYGKSVRILITEIVESWEEVEVVTTLFGREGRFKLKELPQEKQASWLANLLKKSYGN